MMVRAKGPVWHQKQKKLGIVPPRLRGIDKEADWGKSKAKGWVYGHGTFMLTPVNTPIVGLFVWMPNNGNEAKKMEQEIIRYDDLISRVLMDSKADDQKMYWRLKNDHRIQLVTVPRKNMDKSEERKTYIKNMLTKKNIKIYKKRSTTVEPMQGLVKELFDLDRCWMRGVASNRWLIAAMGVAVQIAQLHAYRNNQSTWNIRSFVFGA